MNCPNIRFMQLELLERHPVMLDFYAAGLTGRDDGLDTPFGKVGTDCVSVVALVGQQGVRCALGQVDQAVRWEASGRPRPSARQ